MDNGSVVKLLDLIDLSTDVPLSLHHNQHLSFYKRHICSTMFLIRKMPDLNMFIANDRPYNQESQILITVRITILITGGDPKDQQYGTSLIYVLVEIADSRRDMPVTENAAGQQEAEITQAPVNVPAEIVASLNVRSSSSRTSIWFPCK
ncbi:Hypothetical predicted protein [Mytilus galloprovincialis]|uniref:Uncharacterized protein n=1 Tax=Mytilus galloprovincialis TaxID=29158 RepID=A0A8B6G157_MYTGA|nr:Hypothetical predicted protein [Mytilus galloprovincialis]